MKKLLILVLTSIPFMGMAHSDDFGIYTSLDVVKTVSNRLSIDVGTEYRSHDHVVRGEARDEGLQLLDLLLGLLVLLLLQLQRELARQIGRASCRERV